MGRDFRRTRSRAPLRGSLMEPARSSALEITIPIDDPSCRGALYGTADRNLRLIRAAFDVRISARDNAVHVSGSDDAVRRAALVIENLQRCLQQRADVPEEILQGAIDQANRSGNPSATGGLDVFLAATTVVPRSDGQQRYAQAILEHDLTICLGPAGTGKTYLAVAASVSLLKQHRIKRIVLARPAVEAGEKLGYLPGDLQAKVNPYLRPLWDAMHDMVPYEQVRRFLQNDVLEVIPLAFMRGRTLNHAAIILDEAQNCTISQMLMFLTRMGENSKMIVTGDDSQSDLPGGAPVGFSDAIKRLEGVPGVATVRLDKTDIVRHPLVQRVVEAYSRNGRETA